MSEIDTTKSLADRARRLATLARATGEKREESQDQIRFEKQLEKLNAELGKLESALTTHRRLHDDGVPVKTLPDLLAEVLDFREQVTRIGRPTWQYINARASSVAKLHAGIIEADSVSWNTWSQNQISALPLALVARVPGFERREVEARLKSLRSIASAPPSVSDLGHFRTLIGRVESILAKIENSGVDAVLDRFVNRKILLADLSDGELALLRSDSALRDQLYVALS